MFWSRASFVLAALLCVGATAAAQGWQPPADNQRCPSKWGATDQRGSGNHMKPETVLKAARLIRAGDVFELGRVLTESMPLPAGRRFEVITKRTRDDPGRNRRGSNEELVVSEIGQVGTQFDTFSHQMIGSSMYNCVTLDQAASRTGFSRLGVEQVGALFTRGVLLDIAALKGVPMLAETYEITAKDLQDALAAQKVTLQPGDAVLIHTGWAHCGARTTRAISARARGSVLLRPNGSRSRIRCSWAPTTAPSKCHPIPTRTSPVPATRSSSSSTAFTCSRICASTSSPRDEPTSSRWSSSR